MKISIIIAAIHVKMLLLGVANIFLLIYIMQHLIHGFRVLRKEEKGYKDILFRDILCIGLLFVLLFIINLLFPDFIKYIIDFYNLRW